MVKSNRLIFLKSLGIIASIIAMYYAYHNLQFILSYDKSQGYEPLVFGYPTNLEWGWLTFVFWSIWLIGSVGVIFVRRVGWVLLNPLLFLISIYLIFDIFSPGGGNFWILIFQLFMSVLFLFRLNLGMGLKDFKMTKEVLFRNYLIVFLIVGFFGYLFLTIDQH